MTATTVYEKIEKLKIIKEGLKTNIESYGVTVGTAPFDEYPAKVLEIPTTDSIKTLIDAVNEESGGAAIQDSIDLVDSNYTDIKAAITAAGVDMTGVKPSGYAAKVAAATFIASMFFNPSTNTITDYNQYAGGLSVSVPASIRGTPVYTVGTNAFYSKGITSLTIASGLVTINGGGFRESAINGHVGLPNSITSIGAYSFGGNFIDSLTLSTGLSTIPADAFRDNQIAEISLPASITSVGLYAFYDNPTIKIIIGSGVTITDGAGYYTMGIYGQAFSALYNGNGKLAGTYEYAAGTWTKTA